MKLSFAIFLILMLTQTALFIPIGSSSQLVDADADEKSNDTISKNKNIPEFERKLNNLLENLAKTERASVLHKKVDKKSQINVLKAYNDLATYVNNKAEKKLSDVKA